MAGQRMCGTVNLSFIKDGTLSTENSNSLAIKLNDYRKISNYSAQVEAFSAETIRK